MQSKQPIANPHIILCIPQVCVIYLSISFDCFCFHSEAYTRFQPCKISPFNLPFLVTFYWKINSHSNNINWYSSPILIWILNPQIRLKGYKWENDKWNLIKSMNNIGCRGAMFPILVQLTHLNMDVKRCSVPKVRLWNNDVTFTKYWIPKRFNAKTWLLYWADQKSVRFLSPVNFIVWNQNTTPKINVTPNCYKFICFSLSLLQSTFIMAYNSFIL